MVLGWDLEFNGPHQKVKIEMRTRSPVSRGSFAIRLSTFDVVWALISPLLALWIRNAPVMSSLEGWPPVALYCAIAFASSLVAFLVFRTRDGMTHLFSVNDALDVAKAVLFSEFFTCLALFSLTRLNGIPRSTPLIHALLLTAGLLGARAFVRIGSIPSAIWHLLCRVTSAGTAYPFDWIE